jgi:hypothetical protein
MLHAKQGLLLTRASTHLAPRSAPAPDLPTDNR